MLVPTALGSQWGHVAHKVIPTRAFENGVFAAYANHAGVEQGMAYFGGSCIIAPDCSELARAGSNEEILISPLELDLVAKAQARLPYLKDRTLLSFVT